MNDSLYSETNIKFDEGHQNHIIISRLSTLKDFANDEVKLEKFISLYKEQDTVELWDEFINILECFVNREDYPNIKIKDHWRKYP